MWNSRILGARGSSADACGRVLDIKIDQLSDSIVCIKKRKETCINVQTVGGTVCQC